MQLKISEVEKIFRKLNMEIREGRDTLASFSYNGKTIIYTKVPHKQGDLKGKLTSFIRQQFRLNEDQFADLKNCPLSKEGYVEILMRKGII